ncbi:MAG: MarP family serine protease [Solirubrobacteraceae bacterium]
MTAIDWIIVGFTVLLAIQGYRQGFVIGALSLVGFAAGAVLGARLAPLLLPEGSASPYAPLLALGGAVIVGGVLATGFEAVAVRLRRSLRLPGLAAVDGVLGAALTACVALGIAWVIGAAALNAPNVPGVRRAAQRSAILNRLNDLLPPSGPILNALNRLDPFPRVDGPEANVGPPPPGIARDPQVQAARGSVVRITGTACGLGIEGSGWVVRPGLVVTNAHVVAGESDTAVQRDGSGDRLPAQTVAFDPTNDLAILAVGGLGRPALPLAPDPAAGTPAAILGYPENGPFDVQPGRLGQTRRFVSQDAYGQGPVTREIASLRGRVRPGNSGGPLVDGRGQVVATVFAATTGGGRRGGFGVPNAVVRRVLAGARGPVSTGGCAP